MDPLLIGTVHVQINSPTIPFIYKLKYSLIIRKKVSPTWEHVKVVVTLKTRIGSPSSTEGGSTKKNVVVVVVWDLY